MFGIKRKKVELKTIVAELQMLDDVFHRTIIALERLEAILCVEKSGSASTLKRTAIGTSRDLHDDDKNQRDKESYFDEIALDCMALFKVAKIEDESVFLPTVQSFLEDLFEWYAGRDGVEYDPVDACIIPLIVAVSRQVRTTREIDELFERYVYKTEARQQSIEESYTSVKEGMTAWILASDETMRPVYNTHSGVADGFTRHMRGDVLTGYKRAISFLMTMENALPLKTLVRTIKKHLPDLSAQLPQVTEENIDKFFSTRLDEMKENSKETSLNKSVDALMPVLQEKVKDILNRENISYKTIEIIIK